MNRKLVLLFLVAVFALSSMGMSYAQDKFVIFTGPFVASDNEVSKDVGDVYVFPDQEDHLVVSVSNAYPGYEAYVTFNIQYIFDGSDPIYVEGIDITNIYAGTEMDVVVTDLSGNPIPVGTQLDPGDILGVRLTITMLDDAVQDTSYSFGVDFEFSDRLPAAAASLMSLI